MDINARLQIPQRCILNNRIHKKVILENAELTSIEKKLVREGIEQMTWLAAIKPSNSNIPAFTDEGVIYDEIHWLSVSLKDASKWKRIAELLQKSIPYPMVIVFLGGSQVAINVAKKRINLNNTTKRTIERSDTTPWFNPTKNLGFTFMDSLRYEKLSVTQLMAHYLDIYRHAISFLSSQLTGRFEVTSVEKTSYTIEQLTQIRNLNEEIISLRSTLKKETQFNRRVDLNIALKRLEQAKTEIIQKI